MDKAIGHYSFIGGVILAVILGLATGYVPENIAVWLTSLLVILGLIVGFLNIAVKETKEFLMVATVLIIAAFAGDASQILGQVEILKIGTYLAGIFMHILALVVPATVVVALKSMWALGQNQ